VLSEPGREADVSYLVRAIREHRVTLVDFVPSLLAAFLAEEGVEACSSLRQIFVGGEVLRPELRDQVLARLSVSLDNMYGPTEVTIDITRWVCAPGQSRYRVPIGRPISNSRPYVVDRELRPVPIGVAGELLVGGVCVTRGYLGRPGLTAERFVPDPFGDQPGGRLYHSGDLARRLPDGALDFLGRLDHQVKVMGIRIELGEVEAALAAVLGVREGVVVASPGRSGDLRLVAYVVGDVTADALRGALRRRLPDSMLPSSFVFLDALPLLSNGKVDRKALPAPEWQDTVESYVAPRTAIEELLAGIWAEVLDVERVGVKTSFFDLGGHSLLAVRLMARIERTFAVKVPISALFEAPTVEHLAEMIQRRQVPRSAPLVCLHPGGTGRPLFLVPPVGGNIFSYVALANRLGAERPVYGLQIVTEGEGPPPSMEELASQYLETVREIQPEGPWLLGGWSGGALTAYEMGRQIDSASGTVSLVAMIDPPPPPDGRIQAVGDTAALIAFARMGHPSVEQQA
jgi:acyl carrier protein